MNTQMITSIGQGLTSTVYSAFILNKGTFPFLLSQLNVCDRIDGVRLKGTVAVKVFNRNTSYSVVSSEVRFLRKLEHPNIIQFVGYPGCTAYLMIATKCDFRPYISFHQNLYRRRLPPAREKRNDNMKSWVHLKTNQRSNRLPPRTGPFQVQPNQKHLCIQALNKSLTQLPNQNQTQKGLCQLYYRHPAHLCHFAFIN
jgi:hypothetical protein